MAKRIFPTFLGVYITKNKIERLYIHYKTGIRLTKLEKLLNNKSNLNVFDFHLIVKAIKDDISSDEINSIAEFVFKEYNQEDLKNGSIDSSKKNKQLSKFGIFVINYLNSQKSLAHAAHIDEAQFGKLMYADSDKNLLAIYLYQICNKVNHDFASALEGICANLKINDEEEQSRLRMVYIASLKGAKAKRDSTNETDKEDLSDD